jgi:hypothetical protein
VGLLAHRAVAHAGVASGRDLPSPRVRSRRDDPDGSVLLYRLAGEPGADSGEGRHELVARVTCAEGRVQLGLETQRQWSDQAPARATLALFSLVTLLAPQLGQPGQIPTPVTGW